jgi:hypothetical protein
VWLLKWDYCTGKSGGSKDHIAKDQIAHRKLLCLYSDSKGIPVDQAEPLVSTRMPSDYPRVCEDIGNSIMSIMVDTYRSVLRRQKALPDHLATAYGLYSQGSGSALETLVHQCSPRHLRTTTKRESLKQLGSCDIVIV